MHTHSLIVEGGEWLDLDAAVFGGDSRKGENGKEGKGLHVFSFLVSATESPTWQWQIEGQLGIYKAERAANMGRRPQRAFFRYLVRGRINMRGNYRLELLGSVRK